MAADGDLGTVEGERPRAGSASSPNHRLTPRSRVCLKASRCDPRAPLFERNAGRAAGGISIRHTLLGCAERYSFPSLQPRALRSACVTRLCRDWGPLRHSAVLGLSLVSCRSVCRYNQHGIHSTPRSILDYTKTSVCMRILLPATKRTQIRARGFARQTAPIAYFGRHRGETDSRISRAQQRVHGARDRDRQLTPLRTSRWEIPRRISNLGREARH